MRQSLTLAGLAAALSVAGALILSSCGKELADVNVTSSPVSTTAGVEGQPTCPHLRANADGALASAGAAAGCGDNCPCGCKEGKPCTCAGMAGGCKCGGNGEGCKCAGADGETGKCQCKEGGACTCAGADGKKCDCGCQQGEKCACRGEQGKACPHASADGKPCGCGGGKPCAHM
jgi:hypothetical protein